MTRRTLVGLVTSSGAALGLGLWWRARRRRRVRPEDRIRQALTEAAQAAEEHDAAGVMEKVSKTFRSELGDRDQIRAFLYFRMRQDAWSRAFLVRTDVRLAPGDPDAAETTVDVVLASGAEVKRVEDVVPNRAGAYRLELGWRREDDDAWRVVRAKWTDLDPRSLLGL